MISNFIGNDYFCESGNPANPPEIFSLKLYTADPLWDGENCRGLEAPCCKPGLPWFHKQLDGEIDYDIEARICCNEGSENEDVAFDQLDIYVK